MSKAHPPVSVTFVIPGDNRSGGVRVTVIMANLLLKKGHRVRIAYPCSKTFIRPFLKKLINGLYKVSVNESGWLHLFSGKKECYSELDALQFENNEVVIAVGSYMVDDVRAMKKPVLKVRYNHGFPFKPDINNQKAWEGKMQTITVSSTLVTRLEELSGDKVAAIVPNGIDTSDYFVDQIAIRDGIGCIFSSHPNKAPKDMVNLLKAANSKWPKIPQYIFSSEKLPKGLEHSQFARFPSIEKARHIYNSCKVWLLTSYTEGLPGPVLEAMACGCIVISSDNDGSLEIIQHENNGLIAPRGNLPAFITQIDRVFSDDILVEKILDGAAETVQRFSWERAAITMENFLQSLADSVR